MKIFKSKNAIIYTIFIVLCLIGSALALSYTYNVVREYDEAQPECAVERLIDEWNDALSNNIQPDFIEFPTIGSPRFENVDISTYKNDYFDNINAGGELTYLAKAGGSELEKGFIIYSGDSPVATVELTGTNSRSKLLFFSMADWSVATVTPILTANLYTYQIYIPDGVHVYFNDVEISEAERTLSDGDIPMYSVRNMASIPEIKVTDSDGEPLAYSMERNILTPLPYHYSFTLPDSLNVTCNGEKLSGSSHDGESSIYDIGMMIEPEIIIDDGYGNSIRYQGESELPLYGYTVTLPENFKLEIGGVEVDTDGASRAPDPDTELLCEYVPEVSLPEYLTYHITMLCDNATVNVIDSMGNKSEHTLSDRTLTITHQVGEDKIPDEIASQVDVMDIAMLWSKFMTSDLNEYPTRGYYTVRPHLIRGSYYDKYAYAWATGIDITFTSIHTIQSFTGNRISNFIKWSDRCFSVDVYFEKNMRLYSASQPGKFAGNRTDIFNSIIYFVYVDDTPDNGVDDPHWAIAVMRDVIEKEGGEI